MSHHEASEKNNLSQSMACTANQGQLPGSVSSESGKGGREGRGQTADPSPQGRNPLSSLDICKEGPPLTWVTSSSWKALCCGKAWLPCVFGRLPGLHPASCWAPMSLSTTKRCVEFSCQTEQRCNVNSRLKHQFTVSPDDFKVTLW